MTRPQVERAMTREELMAMREVARKAWAAARGYHNEVMGTENAAFDAWADHHFPLPAPEPQQAVGPSGDVWRVYPGAVCLKLDRDSSATGGEKWDVVIENQDRATVANLLVPFEDVVRATLEEMKVDTIKSSLPWVWHLSNDAFCRQAGDRLPAILKRLESR